MGKGTDSAVPIPRPRAPQNAAVGPLRAPCRTGSGGSDAIGSPQGSGSQQSPAHSGIELPLMGLSAPSRSKGGTWPAALSCFTCAAPLLVLVSQMCGSHAHANSSPPTQTHSKMP